MRFVVGRPEYVTLRGKGKKPYYPVIDTTTQEPFSETRYLHKKDALKWADLYNRTVGQK